MSREYFLAPVAGNAEKVLSVKTLSCSKYILAAKRVKKNFYHVNRLPSFTRWDGPQQGENFFFVLGNIALFMRTMVASAVFNNEYLVRTIKERVEAVRKSSFGKSCERALRDTHHSYTEVAGQPHQEREAQSMKLIKATTPLSHFL